MFESHLGAFLDELDERGGDLPAHVRRELDGYRACGDFSQGFGWLTCKGCDHHRLVPMSCSGRGFCPSCGGRRMAELAEHWVERVFPKAPVRQFVLTLPWGRRRLLAYRADLCRGVRREYLDELKKWYAERARAHGSPAGAATGLVTVIHRCGSALQLNYHLHTLVIDGAYGREEEGEVRFTRVPAPTTEEVEDLVVRVADRVERWLTSQGYGAEEEMFVDDTDTMVVLQQASAAHRAALGLRAGKKTRRMQMLGGREYSLPPRCAVYEGYNLHANVVVGAHDREALRRLCRYIARPPLAKSRLEERQDGALVLRMKRAWSDGTTSIVFEPVELVGKLVALIPPRYLNLTSYAGVFASRSRLRADVVPTPPPDEAFKKVCEHPSSTSRWVPWAKLLRQEFGLDAWACPRCGEQMELRCILRMPRVISKVLDDLSCSSRGPPQPPAVFT
ncbi:MAG: transposase [Actinomycetia bacterium]|nr:transposase [Actinomycetes bacterium]